MHWTFQMMLVVKNLPATAGDIKDVGSIPGSGRCPGGRNGTHSSVADHDRGAWWVIVHGVTKSWT